MGMGVVQEDCEQAKVYYWKLPLRITLVSSYVKFLSAITEEYDSSLEDE
jgi:hypothetical protein